MPRIRLVHWNAQEAAPQAQRLRAAGHTVVAGPLRPPELAQLKRTPPDAVVIDLSRLPMQGRDFGIMLRAAAKTRHVPLVFVDGVPAKVERVRKSLPDAVYTSSGRIRGAVRRAIDRPPRAPEAPASNLAGYSGTPLPKKLGIKAGAGLALLASPPGFDRTLGKLPPHVVVRRRAGGSPDVTVCFVKSRKDLRRRLAQLAASPAAAGRLWFAWPKRASGVATDVTETEVRRLGLAAGLVDYKICAIDATWSGLCFTKRKKS